ncbi:MAG: HypC/HybG/HupF family hydrogenase formation chaperone [Bacteroidetes bacterium]|nr:HypC/HybG/HupF family hydrogenase formation chaperone [Bacteroidota bacterium]
MCLSVPARIVSIEGEYAQASIGGAVSPINIRLVDDVTEGDYVLLHTGFAIKKISEEDAMETMRILKEFEDFNKKLDEEERLRDEIH